MSNDAAKARARRKLEREGGKTLPAVRVADYIALIGILIEDGYMQPVEGVNLALATATDSGLEDLDPAKVQRAFEAWIKGEGRAWRRAQADTLIHARTGQLEREKDLPPPEPAHMLSTRFSGDHWSFRSGQKKDKGRTLNPDEVAAVVRDNPELLNGGLKGIDRLEQERILGLLDEDADDDDGGGDIGEDGHGYQEGET